MKATLVVWNDCTHYGDSSMTEQEVKDETLIEMNTIGFQVAEDNEKIAIAMEMIPEQGPRWRHITWIPKVNIIRKIKVAIQS